MKEVDDNDDDDEEEEIEEDAISTSPAIWPFRVSCVS